MASIGRRNSRRKPPISARDLAEEIVRRTFGDNPAPYVVCVSEPPSEQERLQLVACRLVGQPVAIMPAKCETVKEWVERHSRR
jgi:hypothetical protein